MMRQHELVNTTFGLIALSSGRNRFLCLWFAFVRFVCLCTPRFALFYGSQIGLQYIIVAGLLRLITVCYMPLYDSYTWNILCCSISCVCVLMCVHMYTHMHTQACTHTHTHTHTPVHSYTYTSIYTCMCIPPPTPAPPPIQIQTHNHQY